MNFWQKPRKCDNDRTSHWSLRCRRCQSKPSGLTFNITQLTGQWWPCSPSDPDKHPAESSVSLTVSSPPTQPCLCTQTCKVCFWEEKKKPLIWIIKKTSNKSYIAGSCFTLLTRFIAQDFSRSVYVEIPRQPSLLCWLDGETLALMAL